MTITTLAPVTATDESAGVPSVVRAIDEVLAQFLGRSLVSGAEVVDAMLDLRLIAAADEITAACR